MAAGFFAQHEADFTAYRLDVLQAQITVLLARRTDADHRQVAVADRRGKVGGATQAAGVDALLQECFKPGFDNWRFALVDQVDLGAGNIHANHFMTPCGQTASTDCTHITQTKDTDTHRYHLMCLSRRLNFRSQTGLINQQCPGERSCGKKMSLHRAQAYKCGVQNNLHSKLAANGQ
ncbi:hypothetical protein D3C81_1222750 [compost metagenome]